MILHGRSATLHREPKAKQTRIPEFDFKLPLHQQIPDQPDLVIDKLSTLFIQELNYTTMLLAELQTEQSAL